MSMTTNRYEVSGKLGTCKTEEKDNKGVTQTKPLPKTEETVPSAILTLSQLEYGS